MLPQFNPIVLDVVVVVLLLFILVLGAFKGLKHTLINFVLLLGSIALSFCSLTNVIKIYIIDLLSKIVKFGAGVSNEVKLGVSFTYMFAASLVLTLLLYVLFRLLKAVIVSFSKRRKEKRNELVHLPRKTSRFFGAVFSLLLNGALALVMLSVFTTPLIGGNKTSEISYVTKHIDKLDDEVIKLCGGNELVDEHILIRLVRGDFFIKVEEKDVKYLVDISEFLSEDHLVPQTLDGIQEYLDSMRSLLSFVISQGLDKDGVERDGFEKAVELTRELVVTSINQMNSLKGDGAQIDAEGTLAISDLLVKLGIKDSTIDIFESVFSIK